MSKKRLIPEGGIARTRSFRKSADARRAGVAGWVVIRASVPSAALLLIPGAMDAHLDNPLF
jgi:hypothetical protein